MNLSTFRFWDWAIISFYDMKMRSWSANSEEPIIMVAQLIAFSLKMTLKNMLTRKSLHLLHKIFVLFCINLMFIETMYTFILQVRDCSIDTREGVLDGFTWLAEQTQRK